MSLLLRAKRGVGPHGMIGANQPKQRQRANVGANPGVCTFLRVVNPDERVQRTGGNVRTARAAGHILRRGTHATFVGTQYQGVVK